MMIKYTIIIIGILFSSALYAEDKRDSVDQKALEKQLWMNSCDDPRYKGDQLDQKWIEKNKIKGSWRWDYNEFYQMLDGFGPLIPQYYKSEEFGSNNGYDLA